VMQNLRAMPQQSNDPMAMGNPNAQLGMNGQAAQQVDMRPLPEKLPPRRAAGMV